VVVVSELFHGDGSRWLVSGAWTMADGAWTSPDPATGGSLALASPRQLTEPAIQVGFTMLAYDDALMTIENLRLELDAPGDIGNCSFRHDPSANLVFQIVMHSTNGTPYTSKDVAPYQIGTRYVGTYARQMPNSTCVVAGTTDIRPDDVDTFTTTPTVATENLQAQLDSIVIYQVAP
jgi:hypothetical protein